MGNMCGIDPFDLLKQKFGKDFVALVAGQKAKQFITAKANEGKQQLSQKVEGIKKQTFDQIDTQERQTNQQLENAKAKLPQNIPGFNIEEKLSADVFKGKFKELKDEASKKFSDQENIFKKQIDGAAQQSVAKVNQNQPQIPGYSSLSQTQKQMILERGQKQFKPQIQEAQKMAMSQIGEKLNPQTYLAKFKNLIPMDKITGITDSAKQAISTAQNFGSGGNFFQKLF